MKSTAINIFLALSCSALLFIGWVPDGACASRIRGSSSRASSLGDDEEITEANTRHRKLSGHVLRANPKSEFRNLKEVASQAPSPLPVKGASYSVSDSPSGAPTPLPVKDVDYDPKGRTGTQDTDKMEKTKEKMKKKKEKDDDEKKTKTKKLKEKIKKIKQSVQLPTSSTRGVGFGARYRDEPKPDGFSDFDRFAIKQQQLSHSRSSGKDEKLERKEKEEGDGFPSRIPPQGRNEEVEKAVGKAKDKIGAIKNSSLTSESPVTRGIGHRISSRTAKNHSDKHSKSQKSSKKRR